MSVATILILIAVVFLFLAAFKVPEPARFSWGWMGLALWAFTVFFGTVKS